MKLLEGQRINESFLQCAGYTFQYCPQVGERVSEWSLKISLFQKLKETWAKLTEEHIVKLYPQVKQV